MDIYLFYFLKGKKLNMTLNRKGQVKKIDGRYLFSVIAVHVLTTLVAAGSKEHLEVMFTVFSPFELSTGFKRTKSIKGYSSRTIQYDRNSINIVISHQHLYLHKYTILFLVTVFKMALCYQAMNTTQCMKCS